MRGISDRQFGDPSELEAFFLHCIDKVKADIGERRRDTQEKNRRLTAPLRVKKGEPAPPEAPEKVNLSGITIDDFTAADRRKVVEILLSSEQVLQFLYDKLFPPGQMTG